MRNRNKRPPPHPQVVNLLDQAKMMLGSFESYAERQPEAVEQWAGVVESRGTEADGWAFAIRTTSPQAPLVPFVMVATPIALAFLDPSDGHVVRGLSWPYFCGFDAMMSEMVQIEFSWFVGDGEKIEERLNNATPIIRSECEGWILLSDAGQPLIDIITEYIHTAGVPPSRFDFTAGRSR